MIVHDMDQQELAVELVMDHMATNVTTMIVILQGMVFEILVHGMKHTGKVHSFKMYFYCLYVCVYCKYMYTYRIVAHLIFVAFINPIHEICCKYILIHTHTFTFIYNCHIKDDMHSTHFHTE